jgi:hypothetical protein
MRRVAYNCHNGDERSVLVQVILILVLLALAGLGGWFVFRAVGGRGR